MRPTPLFACALLAAIAAPAAAQPTTAGECHAIADATQRLACYDRATGRAEAAPAARPAEPTAALQAAATPSAPPAAPPASLLDESWALTPESERYALKVYNSNYMLFGRYSSSVNNAPFSPVFDAAGIPDQQLNSTEAKFQISGKLRLWATDDRRWGLWAAYTQQSNWQVYNGDVSRPFRETNYMPELFASYNPELAWGDWRWPVVTLGLNHQSNGRSDPLSRSWNRVFAQFGVENGNLALYLKLWSRISESAEKDDNPDITDYYGHGQIDAIYRWRGHSFTGSLRGNVGTGKGAVQAGWFSPPFLGTLRGYVQVFSGYGESMIDYNWRQTTVGIGIALSDGL
ncbi:MAG: phospholipase A [Betaproteobacteria bacterium]